MAQTIIAKFRLKLKKVGKTTRPFRYDLSQIPYDQSGIFIGSTDAEAETPILWPADAKINSLGKTLMLGKIEGKRRRG